MDVDITIGATDCPYTVIFYGAMFHVSTDQTISNELCPHVGLYIA